MKIILLTGTRAPATLDLARRLRSAGHRVVGADSMHFPLGRYSNAFAAHHRLPSPRWAPQSFEAKLVKIIQDEKVSHILPTCEEIFHFAKLRPKLTALATCLFPNIGTLEKLHHKGKFAELLTELKAPLQAPQTWLDISKAPTDTKLVWKPYYSRFAAKTRFASPPENKEGWLAQRFIHGQEFCSWAWCLEGKVLLKTAYTAAARAGRGAACAFTPHASAAASEFVTFMATQLGYTGFLAFDFIQTEEGLTHVLECNPRVTSGIHLLAASADFFDSERTTNAPPQPAQLFLPTLVCKPSQAGKSPDVVWSIKDPLPTLGQFLATAEFLATSLRHRVGILEATTHDIEYNGDG